MFMANSRLANVVSVKFAAGPRLHAVIRETTKQVMNLSTHQDGGRPSPGIPEILGTESEWYAITNKYPQQLL
jgi:hypothetical protein